MNHQRCLLGILITICVTTVLVRAQTRAKPTYVEIDDLFARAAAQKSPTQLSSQDLQEFGWAMESQIGTRGNIEARTASQLLVFENKASGTATSATNTRNDPMFERRLARVDILLSSFTLKMFAAYPDTIGESDSVFISKHIRRQLFDPTVQQELLEYAEKEIGESPDRALSTLQVLIKLKVLLTADKENKIIIAVKRNDTAALASLNLPPPACIIFRCCH
jgi:hypothetical protein